MTATSTAYNVYGLDLECELEEAIAATISFEEDTDTLFDYDVPSEDAGFTGYNAL